MNVHLNEIPNMIDICNSPVAVDLEMFGQDKEKLHIAHGMFASLQVCQGEDVWVITKQDLLPEMFRAIDPCTWIFQNASYDLRQLRAFIDIERRPIWDTMLVEWVLYAGYYDSHGLKDLVRRYLSIYMDKTVRDDFGSAISLDDAMLEYAAKDAYYTYQIYLKQYEIMKELNLSSVWWDIDEPALWTVLDFEPVKVDVTRWLSLAKTFEAKGRGIESEIGLNVFSHKAVLARLREEIDPNLPNTQADTLGEYADNPLVQSILEARTYRKASSTYGEKWIDQHADEDGLVRANWRVTGAETGRMACRSPNLQNIPSRKMPEFREMFIPKRDVMIVADVSQQETAIVAATSGDESLTEMVNSGEDIHLLTATNIMKMMGTYTEPLTHESPERKIGKVINLGIPYGLSAIGIAERLGVTEEQAESFLDAYFKAHPGVSRYKRSYQRMASVYGYVETMNGRRIWMNPYSGQIERNSINAPIQGGASDFTKVWYSILWEMCRDTGNRFSVCMVIHDELVLDVFEHEVDVQVELVKSSFYETVRRLYPSVKMKLDVMVGANWGVK